LVHGEKEAFRTKVDIFELIVSVQPEGVEVRMKSDEKLLIIGATLFDRCYECEEENEKAKLPEI
jgi:hypothetical protein